MLRCKSRLAHRTRTYVFGHRIPLSVGENVSDRVKNLNYNTAGGRIRFRTDSPYVAIYRWQKLLSALLKRKIFFKM
ncbi:MAG: hypothetical protein IJZ83_01545 [Clostridia bacterium]|nr:hypothetical protein [Clostridia bacterium]